MEIPSFVESLVSAGHCKAEPSIPYFVGPFVKLTVNDVKGSLVVVSYVEGPDAVHVYPSQYQNEMDNLQVQLSIDYENDATDELKLNKDEAKVNFCLYYVYVKYFNQFFNFYTFILMFYTSICL